MQIKILLNFNNNIKYIRKGEEGHCPAQKSDLVFKEMVHDCNVIAKNASIDLAINETAWAHGGHGSVSNGLTKRIEGNPNVTKGG